MGGWDPNSMQGFGGDRDSDDEEPDLGDLEAQPKKEEEEKKAE